MHGWCVTREVSKYGNSLPKCNMESIEDVALPVSYLAEYKEYVKEISYFRSYEEARQYFNLVCALI